MATVKFFIGGTKRNSVPIYVRLIAGRAKDFVVKSQLSVNPATWSNTTQTLKQRIRTEDDTKFIKNLTSLKLHLNNAILDYTGEYSKEWLEDVIHKYHNKTSANVTTLNEFIDQYIKEAESGDQTTEDGALFIPGTINAWRGFQRIFREYQGYYSPERLKWRIENDKPIRKKKTVNFHNIDMDFYHSFMRFLNDEGYKRGTKWRFIKELKMFMTRSFDKELHSNQKYKNSKFKVKLQDTTSIYLDDVELEKIFRLDLSARPELDIARDVFMVMAETAVRISDYKKISGNIRDDKSGKKFIYFSQTKTGGDVVIPVSDRLETILTKYNGNLPLIPEQYVNKRIKIVAQMAGIDEKVTVKEDKYGKDFERTAHKWELVTCHTGRRSAASNMYVAGIPPISIMAITGHKTEKMFMKYIRITPEENARKLAEHPFFRNAKLKIV